MSKPYKVPAGRKRRTPTVVTTKEKVKPSSLVKKAEPSNEFSLEIRLRAKINEVICKPLGQHIAILLLSSAEAELGKEVVTEIAKDHGIEW